MATEEQKLKAKDKRLQKLYGITLAEYDKMLIEQGMVCKICGRPPVTKDLSVDHDHKWKKFKIEIYPCGTLLGVPNVTGEYTARVKWDDDTPHCYKLIVQGPDKKFLRAFLKSMLKRASVRGLLCFSCNGGLRKYQDDPECFIRAAEYLRVHQRRTP